MEISWKWFISCLGLLFFQLCNGFPINLEESVADQHTQLLTGLVAVLLTVCSVVLLAGCLCCQRRNGFKEFRDSPVVASASSNLDHGHVNPIANGEFTIFTPLSAPPYNNNIFLANEQIITRTAEDFIYEDFDVSSWFNESEKDFPRIKLKYIKELGKGWFGKVVEGAAKEVPPDEQAWTPVVVRILEATASRKERVLFLNDAAIYRCGNHANILSLIGRCLDTVPLLLLQEYCPQGDLKNYLRSKKENIDQLLTTDYPLLWCCQLTSALKYLHMHGVTHPDLATRNCQLSSDLTLKIGDYGLAESKYPEDYYQGTPRVPVRWRSPESLTCTLTTIQPNKTTIESNIWSLGVTMWEICECGEQPYSTLSDDEVVSRVLGPPNIRLLRPSYPVLYTDYLYRLMQLCWTNAESRPTVSQIDLMLSDLWQVYKNTKSSTLTADDFEKRWESFKPNSIIKSDMDNTEIEESQTSIAKPLSPSLNNLHGSLDNLLKPSDHMELWLENVTRSDELSFAKSNSNAVLSLDDPLVSEFSSSDSSDRASPKQKKSKQKSKIDFDLNTIFRDSNIKHPYNFSDSALFSQRTSSESETEDENWRNKVERGAYTEKVRLKSRSVADLMVLTHVDYSESESETPLPSLDYRVNYKNVRYAPKNNLENISLTYGSEGNLLSVHDAFQEELKRLKEERRDSLLFVPDNHSQTSVNKLDNNNHSFPVGELSLSDSNLNNMNMIDCTSKRLMQELNHVSEIQPANQVFNVFSVTIDKFKPIHVNSCKLNGIINFNDIEPSMESEQSVKAETCVEESNKVIEQSFEKPALLSIHNQNDQNEMEFCDKDKNGDISDVTKTYPHICDESSRAQLLKENIGQVEIDLFDPKKENLELETNVNIISWNSDNRKELVEAINPILVNEELILAAEPQLSSNNLENEKPLIQKSCLTNQNDNSFNDSESDVKITPDTFILTNEDIIHVEGTGNLYIAEATNPLFSISDNIQNSTEFSSHNAESDIEGINTICIDNTDATNQNLETNWQIDNNCDETHQVDNIGIKLRNSDTSNNFDEVDDVTKNLTSKPLVKNYSTCSGLIEPNSRIVNADIESRESEQMEVINESIQTLPNKNVFDMKNFENGVTCETRTPLELPVPTMVQNENIANDASPASDIILVQKSKSPFSEEERCVLVPKLSEIIKYQISESNSEEKLSKSNCEIKNKDINVRIYADDNIESSENLQINYVIDQNEINPINGTISLQILEGSENGKSRENLDLEPHKIDKHNIDRNDMLSTANKALMPNPPNCEIKNENINVQIDADENIESTENLQINHVIDQNEIISINETRNLEILEGSENVKSRENLDLEPHEITRHNIDENVMLCTVYKALTPNPPANCEIKNENINVQIYADENIELPENLQIKHVIDQNEIISVNETSNLEILEGSDNAESRESLDLEPHEINRHNIDQNEMLCTVNKALTPNPPANCEIKNENINVQIHADENIELPQNLQINHVIDQNEIISVNKTSNIEIVEGSENVISRGNLDLEPLEVNKHNIDNRNEMLSTVIKVLVPNLEDVRSNEYSEQTKSTDDIKNISEYSLKSNNLKIPQESQLIFEEKNVVQIPKLSEIVNKMLVDNKEGGSDEIEVSVQSENHVDKDTDKNHFNKQNLVTSTENSKWKLCEESQTVEDEPVTPTKEIPKLSQIILRKYSKGHEKMRENLSETVTSDSHIDAKYIITEKLESHKLSDKFVESTDRKKDADSIKIGDTPEDFDVSSDQEQEVPNAIFSVFTSTPAANRLKSYIPSNETYSNLNLFGTTVEKEDSKTDFYSDLVPLDTNKELNYSLETWDNFLGKTLDAQNSMHNENLFDSFSSEPHSLLFVENGNDLVPPHELERNNLNDNKQVVIPSDVNPENVSNIVNATFDVDVKTENTFVIDNKESNKNETFTLDKTETQDVDSNSTWGSGGGWFLHPQTSSKEPSGTMELRENTGSYVGFGIDDEVMAAIRNELLNKLPHAQVAPSSEKVTDVEEWDTGERSEVFLKYNIYNPPLSPILEESYIEESEVITPKQESDNEDSEWSEPEVPELLPPESQSAHTYDSQLKGPHHRHTPSQDSCCSNDTLFNLEELTCAAGDTEKDTDVLKSAINEPVLEEIVGGNEADENTNNDEVIEENIVNDNITEEKENSVTDVSEKYENIDNLKETADRRGENNLTEPNDKLKPNYDQANIDVDNQEVNVSDSTTSQDTNYLTRFISEEIEHNFKQYQKLSEGSSSETTSSLEENPIVYKKTHVAPLPSPEDNPWKQLPASLLSYDKVVSQSNNLLLPVTESNDIVPDLNDLIKDKDMTESLSENELEKLEENSDPHYENCNIKDVQPIYENVKNEQTDSITVEEKEPVYENIIDTQPVYENVNHSQPLYQNLNVTTDIYNEVDYVNIVNLENSKNNAEHLSTKKDNSSTDSEPSENKITNEIRQDDIYGMLTDIKFNGPSENHLISTSFSESNDINDEQEWDSGSDTRSSSSGEFIWKEGEHEESLKALRAAPQDVFENIKPMEGIAEESTDESDVSSTTSDEEGEVPEFVPSAWDKFATPTKSALRSPEKTLEKSEKNKSKGVWFKKQKYHCVYEYPREPESPVLQSQDLWKPQVDYSSFTDWEFDADTYFPPTVDDNDIFPSTYNYQPKSISSRNLYQLTNISDLVPSNSGLEDEFYISSTSRPFDVAGSLSSQFFPGSSSWTGENATPDSGVEDSTPGSSTEISECANVKMNEAFAVKSLKKLATEAVKTNSQMSIKSNDALGGLRHTRNKLKLDLPPSPSAFTSTKMFTVEPSLEPVIREKPTFTTFGKSRFSVQHVDTPPDGSKNKNVSFEALPYKPFKDEPVNNDYSDSCQDIHQEDKLVSEKYFLKDKFDCDKEHNEFIRGEASLLDSADEDSGIESSTLERKLSNDGLLE